MVYFISSCILFIIGYLIYKLISKTYALSLYIMKTGKKQTKKYYNSKIPNSNSNNSKLQ